MTKSDHAFVHPSVFDIHVQYCQLDSIGKNRTSIGPVCSIWRIEKFLDDPTSRIFYPTIAFH